MIHYFVLVKRNVHATPCKSVSGSSLIQKEKEQLLRIQTRQQAELQQMLNFEMKRAAMHDANEKRAKDESRKEAILVRERLIKQKEWEEKKRNIELSKAEAVRVEEERIRSVATGQHREAMKRLEMDKQKEKLRIKSSNKKEMEKQKKMKESRLQSEEIVKRQQNEMVKREAEMKKRDKVRKNRLKKKRQDRAEETKEKQLVNQQRIMATLTERETLVVKARHEFGLRQAESDLRRQRFDDDRKHREMETRRQAKKKQAEIDFVHTKIDSMEEDRKAKLLRNEKSVNLRLQKRQVEQNAERNKRHAAELKKEEMRSNVYHSMQTSQHEKEQNIVNKAAIKAERADRMQSNKVHDLKKKLVEAKVRQEEINESLTRKKRRDEYAREKTVQKIAHDITRTESIKLQKKALLDRRQQSRKDAAVHKQEMVESFDKMKISKKFKVPKNLEGSLMMSMAHTMLPPSPSLNNTYVQKNPVRKNPVQKNPVQKSPVKARKIRESPRLATEQSTQIITGAAPSRPKTAPRPPLRGRRSSPYQHVNLQKKSPRQLTPTSQMNTLRRRQNQQLLQLLEKEQMEEEKREMMAKEVHNHEEKLRLQGIFGVQRARASERIMTMTEEHEVALSQHMIDVGLTR